MKKKLVLGVTSLVVASAVAIGGTLAYLTAPTQEMTNNFTAIGKNVSGELRETKWDGYNFGETFFGNQPDGKLPVFYRLNDSSLGLNMAKAITPNMIIPKDPTLKNTSSIPVYMAIKVTYDKNAYEAFHTPVAPDNIHVENAKTAPVASFDFNKANWFKADTNKYTNIDSKTEDIYFYVVNDNKTDAVTNPILNSVPVNGTTTALFNDVHINADIGYDALKPYTGAIMKSGFGINIKGAAIQASATNATIDDATAKELLVKALTK